ncbi:hypothetical protein HGO38_17180 [Rhizobium sp. CG5]|uniref:hypothetical protein n=1 Tax=Rhizobium sp. CG5 TaxID=2726076 RepID=UPI00203445C0|nr:hypothetical protein [Rhizobium sp. CG5]MCM2475215.1 hypothetical protein [Rhizobium sp. CG5]
MNAFRFRQQPAPPDLDLLPPERHYKPLPRNGFPVASDVTDADFITVRDLPRRDFGAERSNDNRRKPSAFTTAAKAGPLPDRMVIRMLAAFERLLGRLSERSFTSLVALLSVTAFVLAGGITVVNGRSAPVPEPRALDITHVSLTPQDANGMQVLLINAIVENRSGSRHPVPQVRADLFADGLLIASTLIAVPVGEIEAGHSRGISAKLRHPGGKIPQLKLSFAEADASRS